MLESCHTCQLAIVQNRRSTASADRLDLLDKAKNVTIAGQVCEGQYW